MVNVSGEMTASSGITDPRLLLDNLLDVVQKKAIPFLESVSTMDGILDSLKEIVKNAWPRVNSHHLEELACVLIMSGEYPAALETLADLITVWEETIPWIVAQQKTKPAFDPRKSFRSLRNWP